MNYDESWTQGRCDKYDYMIAAFSGAVAGIIDIFFVGAPGSSSLCNFTDAQTDNLVKKFAKSVGWKPREGQADNVKSAIGFLENKFVVNYDQQHTAATLGAVKNMSTINHHFKSLSHSPDIVGLFFSILDQFQGKSTFISGGKLVRIESSNEKIKLQGGNLVAKVFCGFCNWVGHLISDCAGSSGAKTRGSGIPIPFMNLFQLCDFGKFKVGDDIQTLSTVMTRVFEDGYDARFGAAMAIPVLINELIIRVIWVIKKHFYEKKAWKECIPSEKNADLRLMLIIGNGTLCVIDGGDAAVRSGGNIVAFILRLNLIGWARLIILVFKELRIRYGEKVTEALMNYLGEVGYLLSTPDRKSLYEYYERMNKFNEQLQLELEELINKVTEEYLLIHGELELSFNEDIDLDERGKHTEKIAEVCNVDEDKIIRAFEDLDDFMN